MPNFTSNMVLPAALAGLLALGAAATYVKIDQDERAIRTGQAGAWDEPARRTLAEPARVETARVGPKRVGPKIVGPKLVGPKLVGARLVGPKRVGPRQYAATGGGGGGRVLGPRDRIHLPPGWTRTPNQWPGKRVK